LVNDIGTSIRTLTVAPCTRQSIDAVRRQERQRNVVTAHTALVAIIKARVHTMEGLLAGFEGHGFL